MVLRLRNEHLVGRCRDRHRRNSVRSGYYGDRLRRAEEIHQDCTSRVDGRPCSDGLRRGGGVHHHVHLLRASNSTSISQQAWSAKVRPEHLVGPSPQSRIEPTKIIKFSHQPKARMGHVKIIPERWPLLKGSIEHILPVVRIRPAVKILLGAVIEGGNAARGVHEHQRHLESGRGASCGGEKARVIVIIKIEDQRIQGRRIIIGHGQIIIPTFDGSGGAGSGRKHAAHLIIKRVVQHAFHFVNAARFCAGVGAALIVGPVENLPELEEVRFIRSLRHRPHRRRPIIPKSHLHMFRGIDSVSIESHSLDPIGPNLPHFLPNVGSFRF